MPEPKVTAKAAFRRMAKAMADPGRAAQILQTRREVKFDARRLGRRLGPAWSEPAPPGRHTGVDALFLPLGAWTWQVKLEAVLGKFLALRGLRPAYLVWRTRWPEVEDYAKLFGVANALYLDDYLPELDPIASEDALRALLDRAWSPEALGALEFHGAGIGRMAYATAFLEDEGKHSEKFQDRVRRALEDAVRLVVASENLFASIQPKVVVTCGRPHLPWAAPVEVAVLRGLNVIEYSRGPGTDSFLLRRLSGSNRHHEPGRPGTSLSSRLAAVPFNDTHSQALLASVDGPSPAPAWDAAPDARGPRRLRLGFSEQRKLAAIVTPVPGWQRTPALFGDASSWYRKTLEAACKNTALDWVVTPPFLRLAPPRHGNLGRSLEGAPSHVRGLREGVAWRDLYRALDYAVMLDASEGLAMACFGVPLLVGRPPKEKLPFALDASSEGEYLASLADLHERGPLSEAAVQTARRHAWAEFVARPWKTTSLAWVDQPDPAHPLATDIEIRLRRPVELLTAADMKRLEQWALHSRDEDYLDPRWAGPPDALAIAP